MRAIVCYCVLVSESVLIEPSKVLPIDIAV